MGRTPHVGTVKQPVAREKNEKGGSSCHEATVQVNVNDRNVADISPKIGIPTLLSCRYTKSDGIHPMCYPIPGVTPEFREDSDVEV